MMMGAARPGRGEMLKKQEKCRHDFDEHYERAGQDAGMPKRRLPLLPARAAAPSRKAFIELDGAVTPRA